ncbi:MAG: GtrA family protein [Methanoregula sp.]|nr:GtrA family protein [Methanoregula sp.]
MYDLTVIIPTLRGDVNIAAIIQEVNAVFSQHSIYGEIFVVNNNLPDRTIEIVRELQKTNPSIHFVVQRKGDGNYQSVVEGIHKAQSDIVLVMDADFPHAATCIPQMLLEIRAGNDLVIGSRFVECGIVKKWPLKWQVTSLGVTLLGRLLFPEIRDPVSGCFAVKKSVIEQAPLKPRGYKILLEVLGKGHWKTAKEIPFEFVDPAESSRKFGLKLLIDYVIQVIDNAWYSWNHHDSVVWQEWKKFFMFGMVGLSGLVVNEGMLIYLKEFAHLDLWIASIFAIELSIISNFIWNDLWTFKSDKHHAITHRWQRFLSYQMISLGGAVINFVILNMLALYAGIDYRIANLFGILIAFTWNFLINRHFTWKKSN